MPAGTPSEVRGATAGARDRRASIASLPRRPDALLLDFDGVIVDSIPVKLGAYLRLYEHERPEHLQAIRDHQRSHGGVTRRIKFRYFEREVFGRSVTDADIERLSDAFTRLVHEAVVACPLIPGALDLLRRAHGRATMHVVSGTPQEELVDIVGRRRLAAFFESVHGAPAGKRDTFERILRERGYRPERVLAIGDALTEYEAAASLGVPFLGVVAGGDAATFPPGVATVPTLEGVAGALGFEDPGRRAD